MTDTRKRVPQRTVLAVAAVLAASVTACSGSADSTASGSGPVKIYLSDPTYLAPAQANEINGIQVDNALFTGLVTYDTSTLEPVLANAASITTTNNSVWTIKLKPGWTFHNGAPVTAQSYIDSWNYVANPKNGQNNASLLDRIKGYQAMADGHGKVATLSGLAKVDDLTFTVTLASPYSDFKRMLGATAFFPMPAAAFADPDKFNRQPIGNGPFRMASEWQHNQPIDLTAYAGYKGTKPQVDAIEFKPYTSAQSAYSDLLAGNLDIDPSIPAPSVSGAKAQLDGRVLVKPSTGVYYIGLPATTYDKAAVRQAISMAIDRETIASKILNGTARPADAIVSPAISGYQAGSCGEACQYDAAAAKAKFDAAGGLPGNKVQIMTDLSSGAKPWVDAVCQQITNALSVKCETVTKPTLANFLTALASPHLTTGFRWRWNTQFPSFENELQPQFACKSTSNHSGYCSTTFQDQLSAGERAADPAQAQQHFTDAAKTVTTDMPQIPLFYSNIVAGFSSKVTNVKISAFDQLIDFTSLRRSGS
ncbi:peptide ABC transporter substrate-binding protein [Actinoallomurus iriomotensis]|uniref:Peptide ABC transporter substrate-binding protein n=1 Tax=Actinoallomurus iriomotensis TaxID=478107 RepID=A0A9W6RV58_9ACTN|nr:ABC transporter substrate-binding protein [Actinoallomurus iriomotensis]GLY82139.1 peptide ABC transporter substrate-binding protein [Actinoallomurus iriomotensis]